MADDTVKYTVDVDVTGQDDIRRISVDIERVGDVGAKSFSKAEAAGRSATRSWTEFKSALDIVGRAFGLVEQGVGAVFDALEEGAAISRLNDQFETLAGSIGTTGDALKTKLKDATQGLVDDASLVSGAVDLISLGLAKTEDSAVRLGAVVGALDWDLQVLSLTLANNSTARLDSLGLSMEAVKTRAAALAEEGYNLDEAFDLAVLLEGEARVKLMGNAAETTAGRLRILQNTATNAGNAFKVAFAESLAGAIKVAADEVGYLDAAIQETAANAGSLLGNIATVATLQFTKLYLRDQLQALGVDMEEVDRQLDAIEQRSGVGYVQLGLNPAEVQSTAQQVEYLAEQLERARASQSDFLAARSGYGQIELVSAESVDSAKTLEEHLAGAYYQYFNIAEVVDGLKPIFEDIASNNALEALAERAKGAWAEYVAEVEATSGDIFSQFMGDAERAADAGESFSVDINRSIYNALDAAGASAGVLADYAVSVGLIDQATADAVTRASQQQTIIDNIVAGVAAYGGEWGKIPALIDAAFAQLESGRAVPLPARDMPDMVDRGYRAGTDEGSLPQSPPITYEPIPLDVVVDTQIVQDAVDVAKGIVEGFANPDVAYTAVMDLDIEKVRTGALAATTLINGIPTSKSVVVNFSQTGDDVVAALRALGLLP